MGQDTSLRRVFREENGDWKKVEALSKEINTYGQVIQDLADDLIKAFKKMNELQLEAYKIAPLKDCLFHDSPVGPHKQTLHLKCYLKKLGWDGIRDVMLPAVSIEPFSKHVKESCRWLIKFKNDEKA